MNTTEIEKEADAMLLACAHASNMGFADSKTALERARAYLAEECGISTEQAHKAIRAAMIRRGLQSSNSAARKLAEAMASRSK